jgi:hypothetical protein
MEKRLASTKLENYLLWFLIIALFVNYLLILKNWQKFNLIIRKTFGNFLS